MAIVIGIPLLVMFMMLVMGVPFAYYLKRDRAYAATEGLSQQVRLNAWYGANHSNNERLENDLNVSGFAQVLKAAA